MSGFALQVALHWVAVGLYIVATGLFAHAVIFDYPRRVWWGVLFAVVGLLPHGAALLLRWEETGHGPYMMRYEVLSSNAWVAVAVLCAVVTRRPRWSVLSVIVMPAAILMIAAGLFTNPEMRGLPPTFRSVWLVFHVSFAKLSAAAFLLSLASALALLAKDRGSTGRWLGRAPDIPELEALSVRFVTFGLVFWTVTIVAGAIWANQAWGRYWGWDVIETWSLITWLCYGLFLHVRLFFKSTARATARWTVGCFAVFVTTLLILPLVLPTLHSAYFQ